MARQEGGRAGRQESCCLSALRPCLSALRPYLSALLLFCLPAFRASAQVPSFRTASSELVVLPVVVTERDGRFVSDLAADRFAVFDNGRRIPIELFTNEDTPVTVGLVGDASGSMRPKIGEVV